MLNRGDTKHQSLKEFNVIPNGELVTRADTNFNVAFNLIYLDKYPATRFDLSGYFEVEARTVTFGKFKPIYTTLATHPCTPQDFREQFNQ